MNPTTAAPNSGIKLHATQKPGEQKQLRKEPRRWGADWRGFPDGRVESTPNSNKFGRSSWPRPGWGIGKAGEERRERGRDELAAGHQPLLGCREPKVEEVENPFIYEGEGVKVGGLCVDFR
jgi:hypothetical protein